MELPSRSSIAFFGERSSLVKFHSVNHSNVEDRHSLLRVEGRSFHNAEDRYNFLVPVDPVQYSSGSVLPLRENHRLYPELADIYPNSECHRVGQNHAIE